MRTFELRSRVHVLSESALYKLQWSTLHLKSAYLERRLLFLTLGRRLIVLSPRMGLTYEDRACEFTSVGVSESR